MEPQDFTDLHKIIQDKDDKWLYKDLTEKIIGAAMEVHRILGHGFKEIYSRFNC